LENTIISAVRTSNLTLEYAYRNEETVLYAYLTAFIPAFILCVKVKLSRYALQAPRQRGGIVPTHS
jgi:hypothetical protein